MAIKYPPADNWKEVQGETSPHNGVLYTAKGNLENVLFMYRDVPSNGWTLASHARSKDKSLKQEIILPASLAYEEIENFCSSGIAPGLGQWAKNLNTLFRLHERGGSLPVLHPEIKDSGVFDPVCFIVNLENYYVWKHDEEDDTVSFCTEKENFLGYGAEKFSHGKTPYEALLKRLQETDKLHLIDNYLNGIAAANQPNHQFNSGNDNKMSYNDTPSNDSPEKDRKELAKKQMKRAGGALARGAGLAAIDAAGDKMLDFAQAKFGDSPGLQLVLSTNEGREIVKVVLAMLLQTLAYQTDLPKAEHVISLTEKQLELSGLKVLAPHLKDLLTLAGSLGTLGEMASTDPLRAFMPDSETEGSVLDFSPQAAKVPVEG